MNKTPSIKYRYHENITISISIAHGFYKFTTSKMVTDLHDAPREKRERKRFQRPDEPPETSLKNFRWKTLQNL